MLQNLVRNRKKYALYAQSRVNILVQNPKKGYCSVACYKKLREQMEKELEAKIQDLEEGEELVSDEEEEVFATVKSSDVVINNKNNGKDPFKANFKDEDI